MSVLSVLLVIDEPHEKSFTSQGFMGKVLIDKLLRTCPGIENIYMLIRQKKGKDIHTRIEELFDDPVKSSFISPHQ